MHRWGLPTGSISNFVGLPARIRVLGRLYRAPETLRGGSITVIDGRVLDIAADGSCVLAGPGAGPGRGPKRRLLVKWPETRVVSVSP